MSTFWFKDGTLKVDGSGHPIDCEDCPCGGVVTDCCVNAIPTNLTATIGLLIAPADPNTDPPDATFTIPLVWNAVGTHPWCGNPPTTGYWEGSTDYCGSTFTLKMACAYCGVAAIFSESGIMWDLRRDGTILAYDNAYHGTSCDPFQAGPQAYASLGTTDDLCGVDYLYFRITVTE